MQGICLPRGITVPDGKKKKKNTLIRLKADERELRKRIIIDAAREVFGKKTYDQVSMAEIARTAGIAKSSIYTYFKNQEELYARIACLDADEFISQARDRIAEDGTPSLPMVISFFIDYYIQRESQWRMITHLALHGSRDSRVVADLNQAGRGILDLFEQIFQTMNYPGRERIMAHTLFSSLSGILIAYRNYPGRPEAERIAHMHRIGDQLQKVMTMAVDAQGS
ncbi:MAG: TetR/AcrR family transcriptional regulator [Desulfobacterales bacterium]|nr:TetR/AcrR family transcriptional regulator [Desulfobacterales bacterium]